MTTILGLKEKRYSRPINDSPLRVIKINRVLDIMLEYISSNS